MSSTLYTQFKYYWEDFPVGLVREFGNKLVDESEITEFAKLYDPQRFHVNKELAEQTIFKGLIASGWQTCSFMMRMMCDEYLLDSASLGSPGLEDVKWLKPVRAGDRLRMRTQVLDSRPMNSKPGLGLVNMQWECFNQNDKLVCSMKGWGMYERRAAA